MYITMWRPPTTFWGYAAACSGQLPGTVPEAAASHEGAPGCVAGGHTLYLGGTCILSHCCSTGAKELRWPGIVVAICYGLRTAFMRLGLGKVDPDSPTVPGTEVLAWLAAKYGAIA